MERKEEEEGWEGRYSENSNYIPKVVFMKSDLKR